MDNLSLFHQEGVFQEKLQNLLDSIILSHDLPKSSIHMYSNKSTKGKNAGKETSKSLCIFEPEYPPRKNAKEIPGKNFIIMNFKETADDRIELLIRQKQYDAIEIPASATIKDVKSDKVFKHIFFQQGDESIYSYIEKNILYCLANYEYSSSFGCCSRFIECSDAKRCVHENKIYSMGCKYRRNLEAGKIFYGKNKNV